MVASRTVLYWVWVVALSLPLTVATLMQHHAMEGEMLWLWGGGIAGLWSARGRLGLRILVDILLGALFLGMGGWSVLHLCGINVTVTMGGKLPAWWHADLPVPRFDLYPALLHCFLGVLAFACVLQRPRAPAIHIIHPEHEA